MSDQHEVWTAVAQLLRAQLTESVWYSTFAEVEPQLDDERSDLGGVDASWTCVRSQASGPVERNSCRGDNVQSLDLRLTIGVAPVGGSTVELVFDALGVIEPELGVRDRALYLVNPTGSLDRVGNTFNVPLVANPDFGSLARRLDPGRIFRVGLRIVR